LEIERAYNTMTSILLFLSALIVASSQQVTTKPSIILGGCRNTAVQAGTSLTFGGAQTTITSGDVGVSPGTSITGNYKLVSGSTHNNDANAQMCATDMKTAYNQAASQPCTVIITDLANETLYPGVYCSLSGTFELTAGTLTLDALGNPFAEWIFQTKETLKTAGATSVNLVNNARADNVYWAIGSSATLGGSSNMVGNILAVVSITFGSGSNIIGRGLARAAVTFASGSESDVGQQSIGLPLDVPKAALRLSPKTTSSVAIGSCKNFAVQAESEITFDGGQTTITSGNVGISPGTSITGNYKLVSDTTHNNDAAAKQCTNDMKTAYNQAASQPCTKMIATDLANETLYPGVYCSLSGTFELTTGTLTLDALGNPFAEWIFQTKETLTTSVNTIVQLQNNARADNVYWAIGSSATLGGSSSMVGNILTLKSITFGSGSNIIGRGLAQVAATFASASKSDQGQQTIGLPAVPSAVSNAIMNLRGSLHLAVN
jgi:Ice-binding-like